MLKRFNQIAVIVRTNAEISCKLIFLSNQVSIMVIMKRNASLMSMLVIALLLSWQTIPQIR